MVVDVMGWVGWIGAALLGLCAVPQAVHTLKTKHANDISGTFLAMWFGGEILLLSFILSQPEPSLPLLLNYALNITCLLPVIYYKTLPKSHG